MHLRRPPENGPRVVISQSLQQKYRLGGLLTVFGFLLCLLPIAHYMAFARPASPQLFIFFRALLVAGAFAVVYACYRMPLDLSATQKRSLFILLIGLAALLVDLHLYFVDYGKKYFDVAENIDFQMQMHNKVLQLDPRLVPHCYRFLPNALVRLLEFLSGRYTFAVALYRDVFMFLLLYFFYRYARLYTNHHTAMIAVLLYAVVYPVTIRYYAGQLTDPFSHLTFLLAILFLELGMLFPMALCVLVGLFVKESIVVVPIYVLLTRRDKRTAVQMISLLIVSAVILAGIRAYILNGLNVSYRMATHLYPEHVMLNLKQIDNWGHQVLFSAGIFVPFLILSWKSVKNSLKYLSVFLIFSLMLINLLFSWLPEVRNLVPALFPLLVIAAIHFRIPDPAK